MSFEATISRKKALEAATKAVEQADLLTVKHNETIEEVGKIRKGLAGLTEHTTKRLDAQLEMIAGCEKRTLVVAHECSRVDKTITGLANRTEKVGRALEAEVNARTDNVHRLGRDAETRSGRRPGESMTDENRTPISDDPAAEAPPDTHEQLVAEAAPIEDLQEATVPADTVVHIAGFPFRLKTDIIVGSKQGHVDEVLKLKAEIDSAPRMEEGEGSGGGHFLGDEFEKFVRAHAGEPLRITVEPRTNLVRITTVDQTLVLEGAVLGNVFQPRRA